MVKKKSIQYFEFPIVLIDSDYELAKREKAVTSLDSSAEFAVGSCEVWGEAAMVRIADSWLPTEESFIKSLDGDFEACTVVFDGIGTFEVPMKKSRFKKLYEKFQESFIEEQNSKMEIIHLTSKEDIANFFEKLNQQNEQDNPEEQTD